MSHDDLSYELIVPRPSGPAPNDWIPMPGGGYLRGWQLMTALSPNPLGTVVRLFSPAERAITP